MGTDRRDGGQQGRPDGGQQLCEDSDATSVGCYTGKLEEER